MALRTVKLPEDLPVVADLAIRGFQYPENETWSVQSDNADQIASLLKSVQRLWPLIWLVRLVSPAMRDNFHGFLWEEGGEPQGVANFQREGTTDVWNIVNVAVLPEYRRKGIGRRLAQASIDSIRERGGKTILLDVIAGNVPACRMYEEMGFEYQVGTTTFSYEREKPPPDPGLKNGYVLQTGFDDWSSQFDFERRITPETIQRHAPITEDQFHGIVNTIMEAVWRLSGTRREKIAVSTDAGAIAGVGRSSARRRGGGVSGIYLRVDPDHEELAPYLLRLLLRTTIQHSPGHRIEFIVPNWQEFVLAAAGEAGCVRLYEEHRMGKRI